MLDAGSVFYGPLVAYTFDEFSIIGTGISDFLWTYGTFSSYYIFLFSSSFFKSPDSGCFYLNCSFLA